MFYQVGPIDHCTHVTDTVTQYISESEYNAACNSRMALAHLRILDNELSNKYQLWLHNKHLLLYWMANKLFKCIGMIRTPNTPDKFKEK